MARVQRSPKMLMSLEGLESWFQPNAGPGAFIIQDKSSLMFVLSAYHALYSIACLR